MPVVLKVMWVDKTDHPDLYQRIRHIGGHSGKFQWKHSYTQAIEAIEREQFAYYVEKDARNLKLDVGQASNGAKYLKTPFDEGLPKLLLNLPEGPRPEQRL